MGQTYIKVRKENVKKKKIGAWGYGSVGRAHEHTPVERWMQDDKKFNVILSYKASSKLVWVPQGPVSKKTKQSKKNYFWYMVEKMTSYYFLYSNPKLGAHVRTRKAQRPPKALCGVPVAKAGMEPTASDTQSRSLLSPLGISLLYQAMQCLACSSESGINSDHTFFFLIETESHLGMLTFLKRRY